MSSRFVLRGSWGCIAAATTLSAALLVGGCGEDATAPAPGPTPAACAPESIVAADFSLPDVNPSSTTHNELVSPRQYQGMISVWYFGHST